MSDIDYLALESRLVSSIEPLRRYADVAEVRDYFLLIYVFRFVLATEKENKLIYKLFSLDFLHDDAGSLHKLVDECVKSLTDDGDGMFYGRELTLGRNSILWRNQNGHKEIADVISNIRSIPFEDFLDVEIDIFGKCFSFLLRYFAEKSGKKAGEYYSPRSISSLMVALVSPKKGMSIYDPVCGSGGFLVKSAEFVGKCEQLRLVGQEINSTTFQLARLNLILHGYNSKELSLGNVLSNPRNLSEDGTFEKYDVVLANPPFSMKNWNNEGIINKDDIRFQYGFPPKSSADYAFILHVVESLNKSGTAAVVVSDGVLFRGGAEKKIRKHLIEDKIVDAIIALPPNMFLGTSIPANILVLSKGRKNKNVLFIDASENFEEGKSSNYFSDLQISNIAKIYTSKATEEGMSRRISIEEISDNDYSLNVRRYIKKLEDKDSESFKSIKAEQGCLEKKLNKLQEEMKEMLKF